MPGNAATTGTTNASRQEKVMTRQDQFTCSDCQRHFHDLAIFVHHKSTHNVRQGIFECYICDSGFKTPGALQRHYHGYHHIETPDTDSDETTPVLGSSHGVDRHVGTDNDEGTDHEEDAPVLQRSHDHNYQRVSAKELQSPSSTSNFPALSALTKLAATGPKNKSAQRKVLILCTPEPDDRFADRSDKLATSMKAAQKKHGVTPATSHPSKVTENLKTRHIDVTKYDKDFVFYMGMKESKGKSLKYMREVFICSHCPSFEISGLDRLVQHMKDLHSPEIVDLCLPQVVRNTPTKNIPGIDKVTVTSFKEYRDTLVEQKSQQDEEDKQRAKLRCSYCRKQFAEPPQLARHLEKHTNVKKRYLCEKCGKSFTDPRLMRIHKRGHSNAPREKLKCTLCSFQSDNARLWNQHYRIHPNKKSGLCHICGNIYSHLARHMKMHSLDRVYPCPVDGCTLRFDSENRCRAHGFGAHKEAAWRFICYLCNKRFSKRPFLLGHWTQVHGDIVDPKEILARTLVQGKMKT